MKLSAIKLKKSKPIVLPKTQDGFQYQWQGKYALITPTHHKLWPDKWRSLRSMIVDRDGQVVSVGLPKFGSPNWEYNRSHEADIALQEGRAMVFEKYDGSLVIRSVVRGRVRWRTRGTFLGTNELDRLVVFLENQYPLLMDPGILPHCSLQMEWVGYGNRVVVDYPDQEVYLLGVTDHGDLSLWDDERLYELADDLGLKMMEYPWKDVPQSLEDLESGIRDWTGREGVVVRWDDGSGPKLLRVKCPWYINEHRRRFDLNPRTLERALQKAKTPDVYIKKLKIDETDPLYEWTLEWRDKYLLLDDKALARLDNLKAKLVDARGMSKKEFIAWSEGFERTDKEAIRSLRNGRDIDAQRILKDDLLKKLRRV